MNARTAVGGNTNIFDEITLIFGQDKTGDAMGDLAGDITRQQRVVEMKQYGQQLEKLLPILTHRLQRPPGSGLVDRIITGHQARYMRIEFCKQQNGSCLKLSGHAGDVSPHGNNSAFRGKHLSPPSHSHHGSAEETTFNRYCFG